MWFCKNQDDRIGTCEKCKNQEFNIEMSWFSYYRFYKSTQMLWLVWNKSNFQVLVCNYGPGGNIIDKPVYIIGKPGSECPEGTTATKKGLCERKPKWDESNGWL